MVEEKHARGARHASGMGTSGEGAAEPELKYNDPQTEKVIQDAIALRYFADWHQEMGPVLERLYRAVDQHPELFPSPATARHSHSRLHRVADTLEALLADPGQCAIIERWLKASRARGGARAHA